jgi:hypothetical protein
VELAGALTDVVTPPGDSPTPPGAAASEPLDVAVEAGADVVDGAVDVDDEQPANSTATATAASGDAAAGRPRDLRTSLMYVRLFVVMNRTGIRECCQA